MQTTRRNPFTPLVLAVSAASIAVAAALSILPLFSMPQGGSVHLLCMFMIALPGFFYGPVVGFTSAVTFSILRFLLKTPELLHPASILLDYILGYGALGLSGFFRNKKNGMYSGYCMGVLGRFVFSSLSGYIFYRQYADGMNPWFYTLTYQLAYLGPEVFITIVIISIPSVGDAIERVKRMVVR